MTGNHRPYKIPMRLIGLSATCLCFLLTAQSCGRSTDLNPDVATNPTKETVTAYEEHSSKLGYNQAQGQIIFGVNSISEDLELWVAETEDHAIISAKHGKMTVTAPGGATIWFKPKLQAPVEISYILTAIDDGGPHDRVSDLNQFWMARSVVETDLFDKDLMRTGRFGEYDCLELYYVGVGGHHNTRTRFRRYIGQTGKRPLRPEHDLTDPRFLIEGNRPYQIRIISEGHRQRFYRDGILIFDVKDDSPYLSGHFGIRTVRNRLTVEDFVVRSLK